MTSHISDELPQLLTGEATREVVQRSAAHLRSCEDCQQELVSAVVAHASLISAQRFAPEIVVRSTDPLPQRAVQAAQVEALPDLSSVFAQVRDEASTRPSVARRRQRRPLMAVAAVAAGALIGGGGVALIANDHPGTAVTQSIALSAFGVGHTSATATVTRSGQLALNASALPRLDANHRYEVWLTNGARTQMKPIGWIGDNGKAALTVPASLMKTYSDIEVSVQQVNDPTYTYSGTSVLRGSYSA